MTTVDTKPQRLKQYPKFVAPPSLVDVAVSCLALVNGSLLISSCHSLCPLDFTTGLFIRTSAIQSEPGVSITNG
jgi:hypothetical protein